MSEFAGVDPHRVRLLANKLKDLADTLAREAPNIRKLFDEWGGTLNQAALARQVTQVQDDARDMAKRADEALNLLHGQRFVDPNDPHKDFINIPWDVSKINTTYEAQQEAQNLKQAMDDPKDPSSRATIAEIAQSLQDHKDDPAYLKAFADAGGIADAARVAQALHQEDGTHDNVVLSDDSTKIVGQFADGVDQIFKYQQGTNPKIPPNADYEKALTQPQSGDMWSVGMLFKYGPKGDDWDPTVLSHVGGAMLDWRKAHDMRPGYSPGGIVGMGYSPEAYVDPKNAWYAGLGLAHSYVDENSQDALSRVNAIDANDPSLALMQRVSENADAARGLLTGPDGASHAKELVNDHWATPGTGLDDAKWPAAVITAATSDRLINGKQSAEAAVNVINAGAAKYADDKNKSDYEKEQYPVNTEIEKSLAFVFSTYVSDFADTTGIDQKEASLKGDGTVMVPRATTLALLSEILETKDKDNVGNVIQAINAQISMTSQQGIDGANGTYIKKLAELRGMVSAAGHAVDMDEAALADAEHAKQLLWFNIVTSAAASVPLPGGPAALELTEKWAQAAIWTGIPYGGSQFPSGAQAQKESDYQGLKFRDSTSMALPLMAGLARSGKLQEWRIEPPQGHPEWAQGHIVIRNDSDRQDFNAWWLSTLKHNGRTVEDFDQDMREAFSLGVG
ncbi:hypothetical protein [Streptomyces sp. HUAS TT20]|uniref:hypothetical protein n=1 Tax=Streptomyces sp. HUAS TT20 TaxID=3447509 RepID=UPI0021D9E0A2|nr:hypothetical protein [Streptomyces sp. HUAS 15-9]UXY29168.1 hypothetical protein N8I87_23180 [Streptomyces sp. HUAS 15-9]